VTASLPLGYNLYVPYMIDGHNLIPRLGLSLSSADDEMQLVAVLREFCRLTRKKAEVYFDDSPPGQPRTQNFGALTAHFVRAPAEADDAIAARLSRLGGEAKNWVLVSSDHRVQAEGRAAHAQVISSDAFARTVTETLRAAAAKSGEAAPGMDEEELREWLQIFMNK
jgi:predicted RNA-binding protein with PIN domain